MNAEELAEIRAEALSECDASEWAACVVKLMDHYEERLSWASGHDRSGLDHLRESMAWSSSVEELRAEAVAREDAGARIVLMAFCDEVARRAHQKVEDGQGGSGAESGAYSVCPISLGRTGSP